MRYAGCLVASEMGNPLPGRRHRRRHYRRSIHRALFAGLLVVLSALLLMAVSAVSDLVAELRSATPVEAPAPPQMPIGEPVRQPQRPERPVFRHSVIPGGAYTPEELKAALDRDHVVAEHYSGIDVGTLRAEILSEDRIVHMSYRIGDRIFWTRNAVRLKKGETILTDGVSSIRARCGNCVALAPMTPSADDEPDEMEFDALTEDPGVVQSQSFPPLGYELLPPITGFPLPWLVDGFEDPFGPHAGGGTEWNNVPIFLYVPDLTDPELPSEMAEDLWPENTLPNFADDGTLHGSLPPVGPPSFWKPRDPGDPGDPFNPDDLGDPTYLTVPPAGDPMVPAPEPATLLLVGGGLGALLARRHRQ